MRPLLLLILVFVLPLDWTRTETSGCGSSAAEVRIQSGWEHLFVSSGLGVFVTALAVASLLLLWSAYKRSRPGGTNSVAWPMFFSGAALLINLALGGLVVFGATFQLFNKVEVLPGGWAAFTTCGALVLEPLLRFGAAVSAAIKRISARRKSRRAALLASRPP